MMTYSEAAESDLTLTAREAAAHCKDHGASFAELVEDLGRRETYTVREVLGWLGY
jgi:hypothetical protein